MDAPPFLFWLTLLVFSVLVLGACALVASPPPEKVGLRPAPSRLPTYTVSGRNIIATPGPITVTVRPLSPEEVHAYFQRRPTKVDPFQGAGDSITPFHVRIENRSQHQVAFDPGLTVLKDQDNRGASPLDATDLFETFAEKPALFEAAQKGIFAGYVVIAALQNSEGLLVFPAISKESKAVFLQFTSLYVGPTAFPLIFQFEVVPKE